MRPGVPDHVEAFLFDLDGVRAFLGSRGIDLPEGTEGDAADAHTIHGVGRRKQDLLMKVVERDGVKAYPGAARYLETARAAGVDRAVVSSSENCAAFLESAGLDDLVQGRVDGITAKEKGLRGKPASDMFLAAATELGVSPDRAAVFEDALAGVEAGDAGNFAWAGTAKT